LATLQDAGWADEEEYAAWFSQLPEQNRRTAFLAWYGARAIGRLRLAVYGEHAQAWNLGLAPRALAQGFGRALVQGIEARARAAGARQLTLELRRDEVEWFSVSGYRLHRLRVQMAADLTNRPVLSDQPMHHPDPEDPAVVEAIGELLHAAYLGNLDDDGAPLAEDVAEARRLLHGEHGRFLPDCSFLLAGERELAGGALVVEEDDATAFLAELAIRPFYRGRGWARALLQAAMNACLAQGRTRMMLTVTRGIIPAEGLYRRMGFVELAGTEEVHLQKDL